MFAKKAQGSPLDKPLVTVLTGTLVLAIGLSAPKVEAGELTLSNTPLFLGSSGGVEPNVVVTMDDSGSMEGCWITASDDGNSVLWKTYTDSSGKESRYIYPGIASPQINALYYNPKTTYVVPADPYGAGVGKPTFKPAYNDGWKSDTTETTDLSSKFAPCRSGLKTSNFVDPLNPGTLPVKNGNPPPPAVKVGAAYYLNFKLDPAKATLSQIQDLKNYTKVVVGTASDTFPGTTAQKEQNFAIWFTYYRNRLVGMKSAASTAFAAPELVGRMRLAYQQLWGYNGSETNRTNITLMRPFQDQWHKDFFNWLLTMKNEGGTPLPYAMDKVGLYYMDLENYEGGPTPMDPKNSPWAYDPGQIEEPRFACRAAYHVLFTDGFWNTPEASKRKGNYDGTTNLASGWSLPMTLPDGTTYTPIAPYTDANPSSPIDTSFVADVAFKYWATDLQPGMANEVPAFMPDATKHPKTLKVEDNPKNDPATWQHMVNFLVSFGVNGSLPVNDTTYNQLLNGTTQWTSDHVDDLWHAAINSRGKYLSANNPSQLTTAFESVLDELVQVRTTGSAAAVAVNTSSLSTSTKVFQGVFDSGDWSAKLFAYPVKPDGSLGSALWDAGSVINGQNWDSGRKIMTYNSDAAVRDGVPFRWSNLSSVQQAWLNWNPVTLSFDSEGVNRLNYLRGDASNEGTKFRTRSSKLGDIANAAPFFVGAPNQFYPNDLESVTYSSFAQANKARTPMVYVGANDGMLHGFNADTGAEIFAYVPRPVYRNLSKLTNPAYSHRYFVDGSVSVTDAFINGAWKSVLVGALGGGGQGIYALDVTDPTVLTEGNAKNVVLWEFSDKDDVDVDKDLGYTYGAPAIVKMANGKWAVVLANGYNNTEADGPSDVSQTGNAVLYIVFIEDGIDGVWQGSDYVKINTKTGSKVTPNGLSSPAPVDINGDEVIDYIYAGDLYGNLWKFDVTGTNPTTWKIAYGSVGSPQPLFKAVDGTGNAQPITSRPDVGLHPAGYPGVMVYFGTGKYIEVGDNSSIGQLTQSVYGIWDKNEGTLSAFTRSHLLKQQIMKEIDAQFDTDGDGIPDKTETVRALSRNPIEWHIASGNPTGTPPTTHLGWYMDLVNCDVAADGKTCANTDNKGERAVTNPMIRTNRLIFTTLIPETVASCAASGGEGWLMEVNLKTGGQLAFSPFDFTNDLLFTSKDFVQVAYDVNGDGKVDAYDKIPASGIKQEGIPSAPALVAGENPGDPEVKFLNLSSGVVKPVKNNPGPGEEGRQAWRRLR